MTDYFTSGEQLKDYFDFDSHPEYQEFRNFDRGIGFSIQRAYPDNSKYIPPKKQNRDPDTYALIRFNYSPEKVSNDKPYMVPLSANIGMFSRYISNHFDFDFNDEECPTEESVMISKRTPKPIELSFFDEYFFDHNKDTIVDHRGKNIKGKDFIDLIYNTHIATVDKFNGQLLRWKIESKNKAVSLCRLAENFFKWLLKTLCGRIFEPEERSRGILGAEYREEDLKLLKTERIDVFGYRASKNVIVTFCAILIICYLFTSFIEFSPKWLITIGTNNLLSFALAVLTITVLDHVLPKILFKLVNLFIRIQFKILFKQFKFK